MLAVGLEVEQVVDDVGSGGAKTEAEKGNEGRSQKGSVPGMSKEERKKDEGILCPLVNADGFGPCTENRDALLEDATG